MRTRRRSDEGQVLGLALVFLTFVALVLAATLTAAATNLRVTQTLSQQRDERYAAEAGVLAAAERIQGDLTRALGTDPQTSPDQCDFHRGTDFVVNSMQVDVSCSPRTGSGAGPGAANRPPYSVLALTSSGDGSNEGVIPVGVPNLKVFGRVGSTGTCYPPPGRPDLPVCEKAAPPPVLGPIPDPGAGGTDPGYAPLSTTAPAVAPPPSVCNADGVATFSPGTYNAPPSSDCATWWFQPGAYYFDFTNNGPHVWTVDNNTTVVGGAQRLNQWTPGQPPTLPGACRAPRDPFASDGVQFVFGGDSRMQVGSTGSPGRVELCPQPSSDQQQIAVYGMTPSLVAPQPPQILTRDPANAVNSLPPYIPYNPEQQATSVGRGEAQASPIPAGGAAQITVSGFEIQEPGSIIEQAQVRVVHREDTAIQLSLDMKDGTTPIQSLPLPAGDLCNPFGECTSVVDVTPQFRNDPTLTSRLNVTFTATAPPAGGPYSSAVDAIVLDLTVDMPTNGYRPLVGCTQLTLGTASNPDQPCPVLSTVAGAQLYVQGTVYAPTGGLDVNGRPDDPVRFNRGIIARTVVFRPGNGGAPDGVTAGGAFDRFVVLNATVNDNPRLATSVSFGDVQAFLEQRLLPNITYNSWDVK
jgi:hypothetical protein